MIGGGPAALAIASELVKRGVDVEGLSTNDPAAPLQNTYGIWGREVDCLGLGNLLGHRWVDSVSYFESPGSEAAFPHHLDYGLLDKTRIQEHWLNQCGKGSMVWHRGKAKQIHHGLQASKVITEAGEMLESRLVIDASGHDSKLVQRPDEGPVAGQAAYGIVGRFSKAPVSAGQFVLMDYRSDHLGEIERNAEPPTFLYAMDLGDGVFFIEETSLALAPAVPIAVLKDRLHRRLAQRNISVLEVHHEEFCLFPMNLPLPDLNQQVVGFGGSASMVHPASGYLVGALLRRAPGLADAVVSGLRADLDSAELACLAWQALWPLGLRRKHALYRYGLEKLMRFQERQLREFFATFFSLSIDEWYGFLTNTLTFTQLLGSMIHLFAISPWRVRWGLMQQQGRELSLLLRILIL